MDVKEAIRSAIKELIVPELDRIREENREIKATLLFTNKRLDDVNTHLADQSRRIDAIREELGQRIDAVREELIQMIQETNKRIDETNRRIDRLYEVIVRREEHSMLEQRVANLEREVAELKKKGSLS